MRVCTPVDKDRSIDISYRLRKPTLGALYFHFLFTPFFTEIFSYPGFFYLHPFQTHL